MQGFGALIRLITVLIDVLLSRKDKADKEQQDAKTEDVKADPSNAWGDRFGRLQSDDVSDATSSDSDRKAR